MKDVLRILNGETAEIQAMKYMDAIGAKIPALILCEETNEMPDHERLALRLALEGMGCKKILRNLYYNYETQSWIEPASLKVVSNG